MCFRLSCVCVCATALTLVGAVSVDDQSEAKPILDRAVKAMGDATKLAKFQTGVAKGKVSGEAGAQEMSATFEASWRGLDRYRMDAQLSHGGQAVPAIIIVNGDQAWAKFGDKEDNPPADVVPAIKNALHALRMPQMLMSLKDPAYKLSPTGEVKVGDRPALGLTVTHKDFKESSLYFDKETGLPAKTEVRVPTGRGNEITMEFVYADYKDFGGVKQPSKITITAREEEQKEFTMVIEQVKTGEALPDSTFEKP